MSYSLAIADGDLARNGSRLGIVYGVDKLKQDVSFWLTERYGGDRFHRNMGSILQDFIGGISSSSTKSEIHAEVLRVLQNYQKNQYQKFQENPEIYSMSEMLMEIKPINVSVNYDAVTVLVRLVNGSQQATTITVSQRL